MHIDTPVFQRVMFTLCDNIGNLVPDFDIIRNSAEEHFQIRIRPQNLLL